MNATQTRLSKLTVKALREIAATMEIRIPSKMLKAQIIDTLAFHIELAHDEAIIEDALVEELYYYIATNLSMTIPQYMAHKADHRKAADVRVGGFWQCCNERPAKVIVYSNGSRQAVCASDAKQYTGMVEDMPTGAPRPCATCEDIYVSPDPEIVEFIAETADIIMPQFDKVSVLRKNINESNPRFDIIVQIEKDLSNVLRELNRSMMFALGSKETADSHTCYYEREVGMSGCAYGCKIYRCQTCGKDKIMHNATYGCRNTL